MLGGVLESSADDMFGIYHASILPFYHTQFSDVQEITAQDTVPTVPPAPNQIALLCGLQKEHFENLRQYHITPMESSAILAYILFAASKLDSGNVAIVKPEFFEQAVALESLSAFTLGDLSSWNIVFFLINSSKRFTNWSICVHQKDESIVFFDPAVKQGDAKIVGQTYKSRRKQLLAKINAAIEKLYAVMCLFLL